MTQKFSGVNDADSLIEKVQGSGGNTSYVKEAPMTPLGLIVQTPYRMFMFALAPLPWQVYSVSTGLAWLIDGLLRMWIIYRMLRFFIGYKAKVPQEQAIKLAFLLIVFLTYFVFAWGTLNYGTAMRHRAKIFPIEIIFVYANYNILKRKTHRIGGL
jgi:hypothetical protein